MDPSALDAEVLRRVLTALPGVVLLVDEARKIRFVNRLQGGRTPEDTIGMDAFDVLAPENRPKAVEALDRAFGTGEPGTHLAQVVRPDGGHEWFESSLMPLAGDGRVVYVVIASTEVTSRVEAERELAMVQSLLPLCSWCRKIRTAENEWQSLEAYLESVSDSRVTHGMCPECEGRSLNGRLA
jgi:PAS domain S-box-containing protein